MKRALPPRLPRWDIGHYRDEVDRRIAVQHSRLSCHGPHPGIRGGSFRVIGPNHRQTRLQDVFRRLMAGETDVPPFEITIAPDRSYCEMDVKKE